MNRFLSTISTHLLAAFASVGVASMLLRERPPGSAWARGGRSRTLVRRRPSGPGDGPPTPGRPSPGSPGGSERSGAVQLPDAGPTDQALALPAPDPNGAMSDHPDPRQPHPHGGPQDRPEHEHEHEHEPPPVLPEAEQDWTSPEDQAGPREHEPDREREREGEREREHEDAPGHEREREHEPNPVAAAAAATAMAASAGLPPRRQGERHEPGAGAGAEQPPPRHPDGRERPRSQHDHRDHHREQSIEDIDRESTSLHDSEREGHQAEPRRSEPPPPRREPPPRQHPGQGDRTREAIARAGPYILTALCTAAILILLLIGWNYRGLIDRQRLEPGTPLFYDSNSATTRGGGFVEPRSFPDPLGDRRDVAPGLPPGDADAPRIGRSPADRRDDLDAGLAVTGLDADEQNSIRIYEAVNRSVVNISTSATVRGLFQDSEVSGSGSGFVINELGYILTNHHVIEGAEVVQVGLFDGTVHDARVVGADPSNDVAVIQIVNPPGSLAPVILGESRDLRVGQKVLAVGNPFGLERTLTTGIVSSLDRSLEARNGRVIKGVIQTDASINPGNSGGPLLNSRGEVIGMNTAIYSRVGQSSGIGFAVPISLIKRILVPLIEQGYIERATLGIARVYAIDQGLLVLGVEAGSPADQAGIRSLRIQYLRDGPFVRARIDPTSADLITAINGVAVRSVSEMLTEVESYTPGETITVTVLRDGRPEDVPVRLGRTIIR